MITGLLKNSNVRQALTYGSALGLTKGVSFIMVPVFTRYLEPADYGRLDILQTLADLLSIVIGMGLADTLFRFSGGAETAEEQKRQAAEIFGFAIIVSILSTIVAQLAAPVITELLPGNVELLQVRLILGSLSLSAMVLVPLAWMRMRDQATLFCFTSGGRVTAQAGLAAILLSVGFGVTGVLAAGFFTACVLAAILAVAQFRATGIRFSLSALRRHGAYGGPLVFAGMAGFVLGSFDRLLLADAVGAAEMAEYALAAKFGLITGVLVQPFDMWWMPRRFGVLKAFGGYERSARAIALGITIALAAALSVAIGGPSVVRLLTPEGYHGAVVYIPWLACLAALHSATLMVNVGCYMQRTTAWPLIIDSSAALAAIAGYLVLIPLFGGMGAVQATAIALGLRFIATFLVSQHYVKLPHQIYKLGCLAAISGGIVTLSTTGTLNLVESALAATAAVGTLAIFAFWFQLIPGPTTNKLAKETT